MDDDIDDLLDACRARPGSGALLGALVDAARGPAPTDVLAYLTGADPSAYGEALRVRVATLLREAGRDEAAARWTPAPPEPAPPDADVGGAKILRLVRPTSAEAPEAVSAPARPDIGFKDVVGLEAVKQQVRRRIIAPFEKPGLFQAFRKKSGGGVLMYGPPGCGKTLLARATAGEARAMFVSVAITDILDKYFGESERRLAQAFAQARARRPAILFFDEIEALASRRRVSGEIGASLVSTFLSEMDGFADYGDGVLVIGATNTPWALDTAFLRPGRFDRTLFVPPPDREARLAILNLRLLGRPIAPGLDLRRFAEATSGYSGADMANLAETAVELAIEDSVSAEDVTPVGRRHLEAALKEVRATTGEWLSAARNYAKYANAGGLYDELQAFLDKHGR